MDQQSSQPQKPKPFITRTELAARYQISRQTLNNYLHKLKIPLGRRLSPKDQEKIFAHLGEP